MLFGLFFFSANASALDLYGHRGARGLSPENTLPAYRTALAVGVDYVDMDVGMTKDAVVVVQHNVALNPDITRDKKGHWIKKNNLFIKNLTFKQLQTYDVGRIKPGTEYSQLFPSQWPVDGTHIPSLKQVIDYVKKVAGNQVGFQIEIKTDPSKPNATVSPKKLATALAQIIEQEGILDRVQVQAFDWRCLLALQKINPNIPTEYLTDKNGEAKMRSKDPKVAGLWTAGRLLKNYDNSIPKMIAALGGQFWGPQDIELTLQRVKAAHQLGLKVVAWTWPKQTGQEIDVPITEQLMTMGVDGIITDRPDIVRGLMAARDLRIPQSFAKVVQ